jgi:putative FmdB family regulatory protein
MPLYEFYCNTCDGCFDIRRSLSEGTGGVVCPSCKRDNVQRVFTPVAAFRSGNGGQRTAIGSSGCGSCTTTNCSGCPSLSRRRRG